MYRTKTDTLFAHLALHNPQPRPSCGYTRYKWPAIHRSNLQIAQFTSIAIAPQVPRGLDSERFWGGTQDNGTPRKSVNSQTWFDVDSGDGGQVAAKPEELVRLAGTKFRTVFGRRCPESREPGRVSGVPR